MASVEGMEYRSAEVGNWSPTREISWRTEEPWHSYCPPQDMMFEFVGGSVKYAGILLSRGVKTFAWVPHHGSFAVGAGFMMEASFYPEIQLVERQVTWWAQLSKQLASPDLDEDSIASVSGLADVLSEITNLTFEVEQDEYGLVRPSYHAYKHCMKLILGLARKGEFTRPSDISTDPNGAIRVTWTHEGREAELVCPSDEDESPYIYHSFLDEYGNEEASPEALLSRIGWTVGGE